MRISDWSSDVCSSDLTFQLTEPKPMNATRILARWICTIAFLAVGVATLQGLAIVVFIICGTLVPGERMFGDSATPSLAGAIILSAISLAAVVVLAIVRHKLGNASAKQDRTGGAVGRAHV